KSEPPGPEHKTPAPVTAEAPKTVAEHGATEPPPAEPPKAAKEAKPATPASPGKTPESSAAKVGPALSEHNPSTVPPAPGETIWIEGALPPGAKADGTLKSDSWKWAVPPEPVYSGTRSHTVSAKEGLGKAQGLQQHSFHDANPPLHASPGDVLFTYVCLDPDNPPKELMLEWQFGGSWEHRAYWGADEIQLGSNFSPSRLQAGALPKTGEWVRLEVRGSEIGIEKERESVTGWSFDQFGGTVYWDRSGVATKPKAVAAKPATPPAAKPATPTPPPLAPGTQVLGLGQFNSACKLQCKEFKGGGNCDNFGGKGRPARAIWGKRSTRHTLTGTFTLPPDLYDAGVLVISTLNEGKDPALIKFVINDQEVYNGRDTAPKKFDWSEQQYPIPAGILKSGQNDIRISNLNDSNNEGAFWYMVGTVEILVSIRHEFPAIVSEAQHAVIQACESFEKLAKKELDPAQKLDQELRLAKSVTGPELQPLVAVLERAQALYTQAVANLAKTPPADPVQIEKLKLTGSVARVVGNKAFIKSQGMEMPVDVAQLPQAVFFKALALDSAKPSGMADLAAFSFGLGNEEPALQLAKRLKKPDLPPWMALFEQRAALTRLLKFESSVTELEATLKSAKAADALPALEALKKDYPDLAEANKERMNYLTGVAATVKK
ncbi:MAG: hypothetical protein ABSE73_27570, partial [Planctomycetota bacterium]